MADRKTPDGTSTMLLRRVPIVDRERFKIACESHGVTMQDVLVECVKYLGDKDNLATFLGADDGAAVVG